MWKDHSTKVLHNNLSFTLQAISGADYMRGAGPVNRAGSVCRDLGTSIKYIINQLCDYWKNLSLAGMKIFHVIAIARPARLVGLTLSRH